VTLLTISFSPELRHQISQTLATRQRTEDIEPRVVRSIDSKSTCIVWPRIQWSCPGSCSENRLHR